MLFCKAKSSAFTSTLGYIPLNGKKLRFGEIAVIEHRIYKFPICTLFSRSCTLSIRFMVPSILWVRAENDDTDYLSRQVKSDKGYENWFFFNPSERSACELSASTEKISNIYAASFSVSFVDLYFYGTAQQTSQTKLNCLWQSWNSL